jgi:3-oxoacyl-[acyl-carrier-protein] synthase III
MFNFRFSKVKISAIASAVPTQKVWLNKSHNQLGGPAETENDEKLVSRSLHIAKEEQTASDLGFVAAKAILDSKGTDLTKIGFVVFVSRTPDYRSPASAFVLQHRLNIPKDCLCYDINMGGAGFIYALQIGCSLLESMPVSHGLLVVGDTSGKLLSKHNDSEWIFADAASAILLEKQTDAKPIFVATETESSGLHAYLMQNGGFRPLDKLLSGHNPLANPGELFIDENVYNNYIVSKIPALVNSFLDCNQLSVNDFDLVAINQENLTNVETIAAKTGIGNEKLLSGMTNYGNAAGASIPLSLVDVYGNEGDGEINLLAVGFGEGFSAGVAAFSLNPRNVLPLIETDEVFAEGEVSRQFGKNQQ